jgi:DNA replicative helicase MCM subunit Mcm2 (Cdc46/Mcm family)
MRAIVETPEYLKEFAEDVLDAAYAELAQEIRKEKEDTFGEFKSWGSTTRENKNKTITEKLDGTNACTVS